MLCDYLGKVAAPPSGGLEEHGVNSSNSLEPYLITVSLEPGKKSSPNIYLRVTLFSIYVEFIFFFGFLFFIVIFIFYYTSNPNN